jgi:hypothetical protein
MTCSTSISIVHFIVFYIINLNSLISKGMRCPQKTEFSLDYLRIADYINAPLYLVASSRPCPTYRGSFLEARGGEISSVPSLLIPLSVRACITVPGQKVEASARTVKSHK